MSKGLADVCFGCTKECGPQQLARCGEVDLSPEDITDAIFAAHQFGLYDGDLSDIPDKQVVVNLASQLRGLKIA